MGYHATGNGFVQLKEDVEGVFELLDELKSLNTKINWGRRGVHLVFSEDDTHWDETKTFEFLNTLSPYIEAGEADYSGDDDCYGRYTFNPETEMWYSKSATISYEFEEYADEQLIEELTKRGYTVSKI